MTSPFKDAQLRAGVPDLEELQHKRRTLVESNKTLLASQSPKTMYDARRKRLVSIALLEARDRYLAKTPPERFTEKVLEAEANADPRVAQFETEWITNGAMIEVVQVQIKELDELIQRGNLVIKQYTQEPR